MAGVFGGGKSGERMAEMLHRIKFGLPLADLLEEASPEKSASGRARPNPAESNLIQPNPT
jgi:UDP-N-acetylmuramoylalanine-D-glutamate ligase